MLLLRTLGITSRFGDAADVTLEHPWNNIKNPSNILPKSNPKSPQSIPREPKNAQKRSKHTPKTSKSTQECPGSTPECTQSTPREPRSAQKRPKILPRIPKIIPNWAHGVPRAKHGSPKPLKKRTCDPYTIYSIPWGWGKIRTLYTVFREGVTKHHYTCTDWPWPSRFTVYSVRIAFAFLEGF